MLTQIVSLVGSLVAQFVHLLVAIAPYFLLGLLVAALLKTFLPPETLRRHLGGAGLGPVFKAAVLGAPLPLCSCGVLPVAVSLYRHGASLPATLAFLVATPQTGLDAVLVSWGLLGAGFALCYALSALGAGLYCGALALFLPAARRAPAAACGCGSCQGRQPRDLRSLLALAYGEILGELARPLALGLVLAAVVATVFPPGYLGRTLPPGPGQYLFMLAAGVPLYMCSTGSLPLAYGFHLQGFSPGSLLVFLLTGPATNLTSLVVIRKTLGRGVFALYLFGLVSFSLLAGALVDLLSPAGFLAPPPPAEGSPSLPRLAAGGLLGGMLLWHLLRRRRACCSG